MLDLAFSKVYTVTNLIRSVIVITVFKILTFNVGFLATEILTVVSFTDLLSVMGVRVLLNMREAGQQDVIRNPTVEQENSAPLEFASIPIGTLSERSAVSES